MTSPTDWVYHTPDKWIFQRVDAGRVRITSPAGDVTYLAWHEWCSAVATVSAVGNTYDTWETIRNVHGVPTSTDSGTRDGADLPGG